jgi:microtubule-associated protein, RP/EB family
VSLSSLGMMDAAYFVGRKELLDFLNDLLDLKLQKIEETAPGHIACQLVDIMFPGTIPMSKVNWGAKNDYEFVQNYKLLQSAFDKHHIQRHIDVDKLIRAKYQDNLEFQQWFKAFFDQSGATKEGYEPISVRAKGKGGAQYNQQYARASGAKRSAAARSSRPPPSRPAATASNTRSAPAASKPAVPAASATSRPGGPLRERVKDEKPVTSSKPAVDVELVKKNEQLTREVEELTEKLEEFEQSVFEIEHERDFYFQKLRDVEVMLQVYQSTEGSDPVHLVEKIFRVLYATADDVIVVNEDGEIVDAADLSREEVENVLP